MVAAPERRAGWGVALALLLGACRDDGPRAHPAAGTTIAAARDGGGAAAPPRAPADPRFVAGARAARDAATKLVGTCALRTEYRDTSRHYYDLCRWKAADLEPLRAARAAMREGAPDAGEGAIFAEHVRLFAEWVEAVTPATGDALLAGGRGTIAHYQDLALAWNAFQPAEPIPVDAGKPPPGQERTGALDAGRGDAGYLAWQRCAEGACVVVTHRYEAP